MAIGQQLALVRLLGALASQKGLQFALFLGEQALQFFSLRGIILLRKLLPEMLDVQLCNLLVHGRKPSSRSKSNYTRFCRGRNNIRCGKTMISLVVELKEYRLVRADVLRNETLPGRMADQF